MKFLLLWKCCFYHLMQLLVHGHFIVLAPPRFFYQYLLCFRHFFRCLVYLILCCSKRLTCSWSCAMCSRMILFEQGVWSHRGAFKPYLFCGTVLCVRPFCQAKACLPSLICSYTHAQTTVFNSPVLLSPVVILPSHLRSLFPPDPTPNPLTCSPLLSSLFQGLCPT